MPGARGGRALWAVLALAIGALVVREIHPGEPAVHDFVGPTMGTSYAVRIRGDLTEADRQRVRALIEERLKRLEASMSTYDSTSELSRLNRYHGREPIRASAELIEVLGLAERVSERTGGALDVTVGPLVEAWGFGPGGDAEGRIGRKPSEGELQRLLSHVDYRSIVVDAAAGTVTKTDPEARMDLSAVAKGYAAEVVAEGLARLGFEDYLVEVGGELQAAGEAPGGRPWRVGIERPEGAGSGVWGSLVLASEGIATSGDYRDTYEEEDGTRYTHIVNPRTGRPLPVRGLSVTVVHERAALADAWATALMVLGPEEGWEVARRERIAALFLWREGDGVVSRPTPALEERRAALEVIE